MISYATQIPENEDERFQNVHIPSPIETAERPWKYIGYKGFTDFMASDNDMFAVRRFDRLHVRAILTAQDKLADLEAKLDQLDAHYASGFIMAFGKNPPQVINTRSCQSSAAVNGDLRHINNGTIRDDMPERAELVNQITATLIKYDNLVQNFSNIKSLHTASKKHIENVEAWFSENPAAINSDEAQFIKHTHDLISLSMQKSVVRKLLEKHVVCKIRHLMHLFPKHPNYPLTEKETETLHLYDDGIIDTLSAAATYVIAILLLIVPLWVLQSVSAVYPKLIIISISVVCCLSFLTFATLGRPFERITAAAGYAAVLVVFLQVGNGTTA